MGRSTISNLLPGLETWAAFMTGIALSSELNFGFHGGGSIDEFCDERIRSGCEKRSQGLLHDDGSLPLWECLLVSIAPPSPGCSKILKTMDLYSKVSLKY